MKRTATIVIFIIGIRILTGASHAQVQPEEDTQSWNDIQLTLQVNRYLDFNTAVLMRVGKNVTWLSDARFVIGLTLKPNKAISIQPLYASIRGRNALSRFRTEHRLGVRVGYRFPIKSFGLSHRSTYEYRLRRPLNSWRYRPSLTFEKDIPKSWIPKSKFFATEEIFYDSLAKRFSRNRFTVGITRTLTKQLAVDIFYMRQNDGLSRPGDLNVIGTSWKVKM